MRNRLVASLAFTTLIFSNLAALPAEANTTPNPYTPTGSSWVTVPQQDRIHFESFNSDYDDYSIYYVGAGRSCTYNSVTATGPFLSADVATCDQDAIDPANNRLGAIPIGFNINFFGTTYSDLYLSTNGLIGFDNPDGSYDKSLTEYAVDSESSIISPVSLDMYFDKDESSIWVAQTTVEGKRAFVITFEEVDACCDSQTPGDSSWASFQLVFLDEGSGDFTAYFNYDKFEINEGYTPSVLIDMKNGVTVNSNIVEVNTVAGLTAGVCEEVSNYTTVGNGSLDDNNWDSNATHFKLESSTNKTISVWQDNTCTTPNNVNVIQDISGGPVYVMLELQRQFNSVAVGWGTYDPLTGASDVTELFANEDINEFFDDGARKLISYSLNTTVPGRIVLGQIDGETAGDPTNPNSAPLGQTAPVIRDVPYYGPVGLVVDTTGLAGGVSTARGSNLDTITSITVGGIKTTFNLVSSNVITFVIPSLGLGTHTVAFLVEVNGVYLTSTMQVIGKAPAATTATALNVGSFNGKLVVYANGYNGKKISWKIGGRWGSALATSNAARFNRLTGGAGRTLVVEVYVDGLRILTKSVVTR